MNSATTESVDFRYTVTQRPSNGIRQERKDRHNMVVILQHPSRQLNDYTQ